MNCKLTSDKKRIIITQEVVSEYEIEKLIEEKNIIKNTIDNFNMALQEIEEKIQKAIDLGYK